MLLRQLRAVAKKEQRRDRDVSNGVYLHLATELFQTPSAPNTRQPIRNSPRYRQETSPGVLECTITVNKQSVLIIIIVAHTVLLDAQSFS